MDWPGAEQVAQRICTHQRHPFAPPHTAITYAVTSLSRHQATPEQLEQPWRGHWSIENRNHYVRDETLGQDRCQVFAGNAARALAALRSGILALIRTRTWRCVPQALRHYAGHPSQDSAAIGVPFPDTTLVVLFRRIGLSRPRRSIRRFPRSPDRCES